MRLFHSFEEPSGKIIFVSLQSISFTVQFCSLEITAVCNGRTVMIIESPCFLAKAIMCELYAPLTSKGMYSPMVNKEGCCRRNLKSCCVNQSLIFPFFLSSHKLARLLSSLISSSH